MGSVEVKVLAGSGSIGGNFVRLEDGDRVLVFDQGIRFDVMSRYYSSLITPRGVAELRSLGVLPKAEWYEGADAIYISHMHLDHLGALSNIPSESRAHIPSLPTYEDMEERWSGSPTWLALVPRKYYVELDELTPLETDRNGVMAVPVSHSAYPAYALIYYGADETVLYTGDFRIESYLGHEEFMKLNGGQDLLSFLRENRDLKVDRLIMEGTNIGSSRLPISPSEAIDIIRRLASSSRLLIATLHGLDLEYAYALTKLASELNLECYIASTQTAKLLGRIELPLKPKAILEYVDHLTPMDKASLEEMEGKALVLTSYREVIDLLRDMSTVCGEALRSSIAVISEPEPQAEEASEYEVIANWMSRMGIQLYRVRASGHYYPYQLEKIIRAVKPREVIPIHTLYPQYLKTYCSKEP